MSGKKMLRWAARFIVLLLLFFVLFIIGTLPLSGLLPDIESEPGLLPGNVGFLILGVANTLLVIGLIQSSRWHGWKLALSLALAYYGAVTFLPQIETWYFLSDVTVNRKMLPALFMMGLPTAFVFIPLAVWMLGKWRKEEKEFVASGSLMPISQWIWKFLLIAVIYAVIYWLAGYFIAWQNPELREFYGSPGAIVPLGFESIRFRRFEVIQAFCHYHCLVVPSAAPLCARPFRNIVSSFTKLFREMNILKNLNFSDTKPTTFLIHKSDQVHYLAVGLLENQLLKKHMAKLPTTLTVLKGRIQFFIQGEVILLKEFDTYQIPVSVSHEVKGMEHENVFTLIQEKTPRE
jgi:quercetin dioxygenase-like cupin family protein